MLLYLMRHGDSSPGTDDTRRPLSPKGRKDVGKVAQYLLASGAQVDVFYHSPKERAKETAQIVKDILNPKARMEMKDGFAPNDPVEKAWEGIVALKEKSMVVSHLPLLPKLISRLVTGHEDENIIGLSAGSVIILEQSSRQWNIKEVISPEQT